MKASQGVVAALATLVAAGGFAREPNMRGTSVWSLPEYTLYSHDKYFARQVIADVGPIEGVLAKVLNHEAAPTGLPTYIFIVRGAVWKRYVQPGTNIDAEFVPARFANYLLLNTQIDSAWTRIALYHEYTHLFLHTQFHDAFPLWFDEGMAELISATWFEDGVATIGLPNDGSLEETWFPLERLLRIDKKSREYLSSNTFGVHRESWAMVHRGFVAEPKFGAQILEYIKAVNDSVPIDDAVQASFGMSTPELERQIRPYCSLGQYQIGKIPFEKGKPLRAGEGRPVSEFEALEMLARVMFDTGFNPSRLTEVIAAAEKVAPDSAEVRVLKLRLAVRDRDDAALQKQLDALEPSTGDAHVARGAGLALFERVGEARVKDSLSAEQITELQRRSLDLLDRSLRAAPHDAEAAWAFATLAAASKHRLDTALMRLELARQDVPMNADLAQATALVLEEKQMPGQMIPLLQDTARYSRSVPQRAWAKRRIEEITLSMKKAAVQ